MRQDHIAIFGILGLEGEKIGAGRKDTLEDLGNGLCQQVQDPLLSILVCILPPQICGDHPDQTRQDHDQEADRLQSLFSL